MNCMVLLVLSISAIQAADADPRLRLAHRGAERNGWVQVHLEGTPTEIGLWINGNSGWGRPIFELTDATGQRWISLGAEQQGVPRKWLEDLVPKDQLLKWSKPGVNDWNTGDVFGRSRINFDGWRYLSFPLPGNYVGEKYPWPANSQWRWDKDGVVHYPLTLRRLIIELPEKVRGILRDIMTAPTS